VRSDAVDVVGIEFEKSKKFENVPGATHNREELVLVSPLGSQKRIE
jgi:hypothetical protein